MNRYVRVLQYAQGPNLFMIITVITAALKLPCGELIGGIPNSFIGFYSFYPKTGYTYAGGVNAAGGVNDRIFMCLVGFNIIISVKIGTQFISINRGSHKSKQD